MLPTAVHAADSTGSSSHERRLPAVQGPPPWRSLCGASPRKRKWALLLVVVIAARTARCVDPVHSVDPWHGGCSLTTLTMALQRALASFVARHAAFMRGCAGASFTSQAQPPLRTRRFVDWLRLEARAGDGGSGCVRCACQQAARQRTTSVRIPRGLLPCCPASRLRRALTRHGVLSFWMSSNKRGPDGGNGGHGGDVVLQADSALRCLAAVGGPSLNASTGSRGGPQGRQGRAGAALVVRVPVGTTVWQRLDEDGEGVDDPAVGGVVPEVGSLKGAPPSGTGRNYRPALQLLADLTARATRPSAMRRAKGGSRTRWRPGRPARWCPSCWSSRWWPMSAWWAPRMWGRAPCWCVNSKGGSVRDTSAA